LIASLLNLEDLILLSRACSIFKGIASDAKNVELFLNAGGLQTLLRNLFGIAAQNPLLLIQIVETLHLLLLNDRSRIMIRDFVEVNQKGFDQLRVINKDICFVQLIDALELTLL